MRKFFVAGLLSLFLCGCAASGSVQQTSGSVPRIDSSKIGAVLVGTKLEGASETVDGLRQAINAALINKKVFTSIGGIDVADTVIEANITQVYEVSQGARIILGALVGQASISVDVVVKNRRTGEIMGSMVAAGKSSGGHIFAGTTSTALDQAANQIADYLLRNRAI